MTISTGIAGTVPQWTLADRLRKAREYARLNQADLANDIGISQRSVSAYEGGASPRRPVTLAWAMRCGVDLLWLTEGTEPPDPDTENGRPTNLCLSGGRVILGPWRSPVETPVSATG